MKVTFWPRNNKTSLMTQLMEDMHCCISGDMPEG